MNLIKRECPIEIVLTPCGSYYLRVDLELNGDHHSFLPSGAMSYFFSEFMGAVYALYHEGEDCHNHPYIQASSKRAEYTFAKQDSSLGENEARVLSKVCWDEEGAIDNISFCRVFSTRCEDLSAMKEDPITVTISYEYHKDKSGSYTYTVDGRDLCYAIGKAATKAIMKYGFHGYHFSTGCDVVDGDLIDMNQLAFLKAYALNAMDARALKEEGNVLSSSFEKELELLLFEM